ncbi:MAG: OsmC family protein [Flavobacteriales bacterium]
MSTEPDLRSMETITRRSVSATLDGAPYTTRITSRGHALIADEPADHGGADLGMRPHELLLSAIASCTAITMRMYADRKGWKADGITVTANLEREQQGKAIDTRIHLEVDLPKDLPADQRERLLQIARMCPVHRTLESPIHLTSELRA